MSFKLLRFENFRSSGKFVTGNNNGSVSLFDGSKLIQTKRLGLNAVQVEYLNGQIVAAIKDGNLLILNRSLGIIKEFMDTNYKVGAICGNSNYLAVCDYSGFVWYYQRGYSEQVIYLSFDPILIIISDL